MEASRRVGKSYTIWFHLVLSAVGTDYRETEGHVVTLSAGSSRAGVSYSIVNDNLFEGTETFSVYLTIDSVWVGSGVQLGTPNRTVVEITDDDSKHLHCTQSVPI